MKLTVKQTKALDILEDNSTIELYYGGAAGGGKSALGCYWQLKRRLKYPGTKGLLGRSELITLKETTLSTFFQIAKIQGVKKGFHFDQTSAQDSKYPNCLVFANTSVIHLKDLKTYPTDPDFDSLGSLEITDGFIDEGSQITSKAKNIVRSRIRFKLNEYKLIPKLLISGNPSKGYPYFEFYKPHKQGELTLDKKFVQALPGDNPYLPVQYIKSLEGLDRNSRERLLYGNWEYDDDPSALIGYDKILQCFSLAPLKFSSDEKFMTIDVARFGKDKTVIGIWHGWSVKLYPFFKLSIIEVTAKIKYYQQFYSISTDNIIADEDGVGGGVVDMMGCNGFINNSSALGHPITHEPMNYNNLKSQCYFMLAERITEDGLRIECENPEMKNEIIQELEQIKQWQMDKDRKKEIIPKDKIKELIGRSPDYADTIMMREWFELKQKATWMAG